MANQVALADTEFVGAEPEEFVWFAPLQPCTVQGDGLDIVGGVTVHVVAIFLIVQFPFPPLIVAPLALKVIAIARSVIAKYVSFDVTVLGTLLPQPLVAEAAFSSAL